MSTPVEEFLNSLSETQRQPVKQLHDWLIGHDCQIEIKTAKSGYAVSYLTGSPKRTLANFVCRKTGIKMRLYPQALHTYEPFLDTLPEKLKKDIRKASVCKRMIDPDDCNPRCQTGYDFMMDGEHYQKCRYMAFMPTVTQESLPYLIDFLEHEFQAAGTAQAV